MIVREDADSFVLIRQHDHALASGEFAAHFAATPRPLEETLYAIAHHDVAWQDLDASIRWNEETGRPYSFVDLPADLKVDAYVRGLDLLEVDTPYASCLCSMHYSKLLQRYGGTGVEARFVDDESQRQERLRSAMSAEQLENLDRDLALLRLCDGLSLYVCLNAGGATGYPPPYPEGFEFDGTRYEPHWSEAGLRLDPNPLTGPFALSIPHQRVSADRRPLGGGQIDVRIVARA